MPNCFNLFGVEICIPTADDIISGISKYIEENLEPWLQEVLEGIVNTFSQALTDITDIYGQALVSASTSAVSGIVQNAYSLLKPVTDYLSPLTETFKNSYDTLLELSENLYNIGSGIGEALTSGFDSLVKLIATYYSDLGEMFTEFGNVVIDSFNTFSANFVELMNNVYQTLLSTYEQLESFVEWARQDLMTGISNLSQGVNKLAENFPEAWKSFTDTVSNIARYFDPHYLANIMKPYIDEAGKIVNSSLETLFNLWREGWEIQFKLIGEGLQYALDPKGDVWRIIKDLVLYPYVKVSELMYKSILDLLEYEPPITFEKSQKAIEKYLSVLMMFSSAEMTASLLEVGLGLAGDVQVMGTRIPGQVFTVARPFSRLFRSLSFNMGFGWLTWTIWSDVFRSVITTGMERYYRQKYRPKDPTLAMLQEAYRRGFINDDELRAGIAFLGYADEWFNLIRDTALYYPSPDRIQEWLARRLIDTDTAKLYLRRYGIEEKYQDYYINTAYRLLTTSDTLEAYYRGIWNEDKVKEYLRSLGYREEDLDVLIKVNERILSYSTIFEAYEWGLIDEKKMSEMLYKLGLRGDELAIMVELGKRRAVSDEVSSLKTRLMHLYSFGVIDRMTAEQNLLGLGIPRDQVDLTIRAYDYDKQLEIVEDYVASILREFRDGKIDEVTLRILISPFVQDPVKIESLIAYQRSLREKKPAYILPPMYMNRREYLNKIIINLNKQIEYLSKLYTQMMKEYVALINLIESEMGSYPDEFKAIAKINLEKIREEMRARQEYYVNLIAQLQFNLYIYQRLLEII